MKAGRSGLAAAPNAISETGMALLLCLLFLTALTLLGLSAASETVMQDKLAGNLQEANEARQSALAAQDWAEAWLLGQGEVAPAPCTQPCEGLIIHTSGTLSAKPETEDASWWLANGMEAGLDPVSHERLAALAIESATPSLWIIEALHQDTLAEGPGVQAWYRILARGSGRTGRGVAVVESIVTRPWRPVATEGVVLQGICPGFDPGATCRRVAWRRLR